MAFYTFGPFSLDEEARVLMRDGKAVPLTGKVFDTLIVLVQNRGRVIPKEQLLATVWPGTIVEEANLTQNVSTAAMASFVAKGFPILASVWTSLRSSSILPLRLNRTRAARSPWELFGEDYPERITAGQDGPLWFTECYRRKSGAERATPQGTAR